MAMHTVAPMTGTEIALLLGAIVVGFLLVMVMLFIGTPRRANVTRGIRVARHLSDETSAIRVTPRPRHAERDVGVAHVERECRG